MTIEWDEVKVNLYEITFELTRIDERPFEHILWTIADEIRKAGSRIDKAHASEGESIEGFGSGVVFTLQLLDLDLRRPGVGVALEDILGEDVLHGVDLLLVDEPVLGFARSRTPLPTPSTRWGGLRCAVNSRSSPGTSPRS